MNSDSDLNLNPQVIAEIEVDDEVLNISARRREGEKLDKLTKEENERLRINQEKSKFFNKSLYDLGEDTANAAVAVLDDVINSNSLSDVTDAFIKDDRLIYIGLITVILGIIISILLITIKN